MAALVCDICGGKLVMGAGGVAVCDSCGIEHSADRMREKVQGIKGTVQVDSSHLKANYFEMAQNAYDSGNQAEAELYCNKIIETDPLNYQAWLLKGKSAGWQSTLKNLRFAESVSAFSRAIQNAPDDEKERITEEAKEEIKKLSRALIALRAERFVKWPDEEESNGFRTDLMSILEAMVKFIQQAGVVISVSEMMSPIATQINQAVTKAWTDKILPDYKGDEGRPNKYEWKQFIERIGHCTSLLERAINLCDDDEADDITRYENLIFLHNQAIESCSWDYEFVGSSKSWHKDCSLTDDAKAARSTMIAEYKKKIAAIKAKQDAERRRKMVADSADKSDSQLVSMAMEHLDKWEFVEAQVIFDILIERLPNECFPYMGKAIIYSRYNAADAFSTFMNVKDKVVSPEFQKETQKLLEFTAAVGKMTMLGLACREVRFDVFRVLIDMGADIHAKSDSNVTPLWYLCYKPLPTDKVVEGRAMAKILLDMGASADVTSSYGTALYNKSTDPEIAKMIVAKYPNLAKGRGLSSGGCYVATAVYGSYDCPQVWTLRRYRDYTLAETWYGRAFIRTYYAVSPTLVKWFGHTEWFKKMWKGKLDKMVSKLQSEGVESTPYEDRNW